MVASGRPVVDQLRVAAPVEQLWHRVPGGTARATEETLVALAETGAVSLCGLAARHRRDDRVRAERLGPITYSRLPRPALYEGWLRLGRPRVESLVGPVDVVWASSMIAVPTVEAPIVATVHDLGFLDEPSHNSRRGRSFFPRAWALVRDRAQRVVCPSTAVAERCVDAGVSATAVSVVPWGVRMPASSLSAAQAVVDARGLPERYVLWVGALEPRKNLPRLVEAVARLDDVSLVVAGPDGWNVDGVDLLAPLGDRAIRLGRVDDHELSALYRGATVFAFPSLLEGFGLPVLEALAHGTPVVTSAGTATEEVAGGAARLVDPLDAGELAAAIEATWTDEAETRRLVELGRRRAAELTWANTAEGYLDVFRAVCR